MAKIAEHDRLVVGVDQNTYLFGFRNPATLDFHLVKGSRAIGHGDPNSAPARDIDGQRRPQGRRVDAGADERP